MGSSALIEELSVRSSGRTSNSTGAEKPRGRRAGPVEATSEQEGLVTRPARCCSFPSGMLAPGGARCGAGGCIVSCSPGTVDPNQSQAPAFNPTNPHLAVRLLTPPLAIFFASFLAAIFSPLFPLNPCPVLRLNFSGCTVAQNFHSKPSKPNIQQTLIPTNIPKQLFQLQTLP